jgi:hypothetical protein
MIIQLLGYLTLQNNTTGSYNVGLGSETMFDNTGGYNTAVGSMALRSNIMETITRLWIILCSNTLEVEILLLDITLT